MPLYTYTCKNHGQFSAWATMEHSNDDQTCPSCSHPAPRALAKPAIGGRSSEGAGDDGDFGGCGDDACGMDAGMGGHCCGPGCMH